MREARDIIASWPNINSRRPAGASSLRNDKELSRFRASNFLLDGARESHQRRTPPRSDAFRASMPSRFVLGARWSTIVRSATAPALLYLGHPATAPALPYLGHPCPRHALALYKRRQAASMRPPCGLSAPTDHRRSGAPLKRSALQARRSNSYRASAHGSPRGCRDIGGRTNRVTAFGQKRTFPSLNQVNPRPDTQWMNHCQVSATGTTQH